MLLSLGFSIGQTVIAILLVVIGFVSYYVTPMALMNSNFQIFFGIMCSILLLMLLSFTMLANFFQQTLQLLVLNCLTVCF